MCSLLLLSLPSLLWATSEIPYKSSLDAKDSEFLFVILVPVLGIMFQLPCDKTWETRVARLPSFQPRLNPQHLCKSPDFWEVSLDHLIFFASGLAKVETKYQRVASGHSAQLVTFASTLCCPCYSQGQDSFFFPCLCFPSVWSKLAGHRLALSPARDLKWEDIFPSAQKPREAIQDAERAVLIRSSRESRNRQI